MSFRRLCGEVGDNYNTRLQSWPALLTYFGYSFVGCREEGLRLLTKKKREEKCVFAGNLVVVIKAWIGQEFVAAR